MFLYSVNSCFFFPFYYVKLCIRSAIHYIIRYTIIYFNEDRLQNNKTYPSRLLPSTVLLLPFCPSFFDLRPWYLELYGDLLAQSMIPGFSGISITRHCKLSRRYDKAPPRAAGGGFSSEILTIARRGRSVYRREARARPLISSRNSTYRVNARPGRIMTGR